MEQHSQRSRPDGSPRLLAFALALAACASTSTSASAATGVAQARNEAVSLRVEVAADGHIAASRPTDAQSPLNGIAQQFASKLVLTPARKDGQPVASTTCLTLGLAAEPRPDGTFGIKLKRAINGPCVASMGKSLTPEVSRSQGGIVVLGANLLADGSVDPATLATERAELRKPSSFDEARYTKAAMRVLRETRFELDTVDGKPVTAHVSAPFLFNGGPGQRKGDERDAAGDTDRYGRSSAAGRRGSAPSEMVLPSWNATSTVAGTDLPKIDYTQP